MGKITTQIFPYLDKRLELISRYSKINVYAVKEINVMATTDKLTVAGIRFRTRADYEAALRDQKKLTLSKLKLILTIPDRYTGSMRNCKAGVTVLKRR